jgi:hypothetical protein
MPTPQTIPNSLYRHGIALAARAAFDVILSMETDAVDVRGQ